MSQNEIIRQAFADLEDGDSVKRIAALATLGQFKVTDAVSRIVPLLPDDTAGQAAASALIAIGTAAVRDDVELFEQPDFNAAQIASLNADDIVTVLRFTEARDWAYVRTHDGVEGWLWSALLSSPLSKVGAKPPAPPTTTGRPLPRLDEVADAIEGEREPSRSLPKDLLDELEETPPPPPARPGAVVTQPTPAPAPQSAGQAVQFSAYYPKEVPPNLWLGLRAYIYRISAAPQVLEDAKQQLGDAINDYRKASDTARTEDGLGVRPSGKRPHARRDGPQA